MIVVVGITGDEPGHWWLDDSQRSWGDLRQ